MNTLQKTLILGVVLLFVGTSVVPSTGTIVVNKSTMSRSNGNTLYVGGSGEGNYTRIQDAIDNASDGDTVFVYDDLSPYYENVVVNKRINLVGEDKNTTIIDGGEKGDVVLIKSYGVQIRGFTIKNSGSDYDAGIKVEASGVTIKNNIISNNDCGIAVLRKRGRYYHNIKITKNIITNSVVGICIGGDCRGDEYSGFIYNIKITANYITNNYWGIDMPCWAVHNIIMLNEIRDNKESGIEIGWGGIYCFDTLLFGNIVKKNNFINNGKNAYFYLWHSIWHRNYWDDWDGFFYVIKGGAYGYPTEYNFDFFPARKPYDIPIEEIVVGKQEKQISQQISQLSSTSSNSQAVQLIQ